MESQQKRMGNLWETKKQLLVPVFPNCTVLLTQPNSPPMQGQTETRTNDASAVVPHLPPPHSTPDNTKRFIKSSVTVRHLHKMLYAFT